MNDVYFACKDCRVLLDAGCRWALSTLVDAAGFREASGLVCIDAVSASPECWNPPDEPDSRWLKMEILPSVHAFLSEHRNHRIDFGEFGALVRDESFLDWLQIGYGPEPTPRYFAEVLKFRSWDEVTAWLSELDERRYDAPGWRHDAVRLRDVRRRFEASVGKLVPR